MSVRFLASNNPVEAISFEPTTFGAAAHVRPDCAWGPSRQALLSEAHGGEIGGVERSGATHPPMLSPTAWGEAGGGFGVIEIDGYGRCVPIGRGGVGAVYRSTRLSTGAEVAIKVLHHVSDESSAWRRTRRELAAMVALAGHAHVIGVLEVHDLPHGPALVMEYAAGGSVGDLMAQRATPLMVGEAALIGEHASKALIAAHARGIVHRDVKPHNLLIDGFGQVKLCDFGIAALVRTDEFRAQTHAVSLRYASPEDLEGDAEVDASTDIFSLGATLLHLVHGAPPTMRDRLVAWMPPTDRSGRGVAALHGIIAECLRLDPADRPTAAEVFDLLEHLPHGVDRRKSLVVSVSNADDTDHADRLAGRRHAAGRLGGEDARDTGGRPSAAVGGGEGDSAAGAVGGGRVAGRGPGGEFSCVGAGDRDGAGGGGGAVGGAPLGDPAAHVPVGDHTVLRPTRTAGAPAVRAVPGAVDEPSPKLRSGPPRRPRLVAILPLVALLWLAGVLVWQWATRDDGNGGAPSTAGTAVVLAERPVDLADITTLVWPPGEVGECLAQTGSRDALVEIGCDQPHDLQRVSAAALGATDDVPTVAALEAAVIGRCRAAWEAVRAASSIVIPLDVQAALQLSNVRPDDTAVAAGDRAYQCFAGAPARRLVGDLIGPEPAQNHP